MGKHRSIKSFFAEYLVVMILAFVIDLFFCLMLLYAGVSFGILVTQNQTETQISQREIFLKKAQKIEKSDIPTSCRYVVFKKDGTYLYGNVTKRQAKDAIFMYQQNRRISSGFLMTGLGADCYYPIERDSEVCSLLYTAGTQYKSLKLQARILSPELMIFSIGGVFVLTEILGISALYGKKIGKKLLPLQYATEEIGKQNLEFAMTYSGMKEIDIILHSMEALKENLKEALLLTWKTENLKEMQMSALAHDLKTPLTLIIGNTQLLQETFMTEEQKEFAHYIASNASRLEEYIQMLNQIISSKRGLDFCKKTVDCAEFLKQLLQEMHMMTQLKEIELVSDVNEQMQEQRFPQVLYVDEAQLRRALLNIVSNAIDYSMSKQKIYFHVEIQHLQKQEKMIFQIKDEGKGFTTEEQVHATEQFYQGDPSRTRKSHYGMGLYIAKMVASNHGGEILLHNDATKGACVSLSILNVCSNDC